MEREQITRADFNLSHAAQQIEDRTEFLAADLEDLQKRFTHDPL
jgi:hypothetical protein